MKVKLIEKKHTLESTTLPLCLSCFCFFEKLKVAKTSLGVCILTGNKVLQSNSKVICYLLFYLS